MRGSLQVNADGLKRSNHVLLKVTKVHVLLTVIRGILKYHRIFSGVIKLFLTRLYIFQNRSRWEERISSTTPVPWKVNIKTVFSWQVLVCVNATNTI